MCALVRSSSRTVVGLCPVPGLQGGRDSHVCTVWVCFAASLAHMRRREFAVSFLLCNLDTGAGTLPRPFHWLLDVRWLLRRFLCPVPAGCARSYVCRCLLDSAIVVSMRSTLLSISGAI